MIQYFSLPAKKKPCDLSPSWLFCFIRRVPRRWSREWEQVLKTTRWNKKQVCRFNKIHFHHIFIFTGSQWGSGGQNSRSFQRRQNKTLTIMIWKQAVLTLFHPFVCLVILHCLHKLIGSTKLAYICVIHQFYNFTHKEWNWSMLEFHSQGI